jgi:hypothetical protein
MLMVRPPEILPQILRAPGLHAPLNVKRRMIAPFLSAQECFQLLGDDLVQDRGFWLTRSVVERGGF